jgi:hypothetical protein
MRALTGGELAVLREVQDVWGQQNRPENVTFTAENEAVLFARDRVGAMQVVVNLSNLAAWSAAGDLSPDELRRWVSGPKGSHPSG